MYNPQPDRSAEILANANNQAAALQLEGMQSLGNSFAAMGQNVADAYEKASKNQLTVQYLDAVAGELSQTQRPDGTYYISAEELEDVSKSGLGRKQAIINARMAQHQFDQSTQRQQAQYDNALELARQKAALRAGGTGGGGSSTPAFGVDVADGVDLGW
jgi:hypothetical protein